MTQRIVGIGQTQTVTASEADDVTFLGAGTLNIFGAPGAPIDVTLSRLAGIGLLDTISISNANVTVQGVAGASALAGFQLGSGAHLKVDSTLNLAAGTTFTFTGPNSQLELGSGLTLPLLGGISGFAPGRTIDVHQLARSVSYADAAGDNTGGTLTLLDGNGGAVGSVNLLTGNYASGSFKLQSDSNGGTLVSIKNAATDLNGDGTSDVVLQNGGTVVDWTIAGGAYQAGNVITMGADGYSVVGSGDVNGDGTADLLLRSGGVYVEWFMKDGAYQSGSLLGDAGGASVVGTGDFNNDGTSDILLQNGGTVFTWTMKDGQIQASNVITTEATGYTVVGTGDFNGDGNADILLQNGNSVVEWFMQNGIYQSGRLLGEAGSGTVAGVGDFNGDGTDDVLLRDGNTVTNWTVQNGILTSINTITDNLDGFAVRTTGDYNGDGTTDVLLQKGGTVAEWFMANGQYQSGAVISTTATDYTIPSFNAGNNTGGSGAGGFDAAGAGGAMDLVHLSGN